MEKVDQTRPRKTKNCVESDVIFTSIQQDTTEHNLRQGLVRSTAFVALSCQVLLCGWVLRCAHDDYPFSKRHDWWTIFFSWIFFFFTPPSRLLQDLERPDFRRSLCPLWEVFDQFRVHKRYIWICGMRRGRRHPLALFLFRERVLVNDVLRVENESKTAKRIDIRYCYL